MALHTCRMDGAGEVSGAVVVAGAVDPLLSIGPEANGQFQQAVALPVEVCLAPLAGAGNDVDALGSLLKIWREAGKR